MSVSVLLGCKFNYDAYPVFYRCFYINDLGQFKTSGYVCTNMQTAGVTINRFCHFRSNYQGPGNISILTNQKVAIVLFSVLWIHLHKIGSCAIVSKMKSEAFSTCRLSHVTQSLRHEGDTVDKLEMNTIRSTEYISADTRLLSWRPLHICYRSFMRLCLTISTFHIGWSTPYIGLAVMILYSIRPK